MIYAPLICLHYRFLRRQTEAGGSERVSRIIKHSWDFPNSALSDVFQHALPRFLMTMDSGCSLKSKSCANPHTDHLPTPRSFADDDDPSHKDVSSVPDRKTTSEEWKISKTFEFSQTCFLSLPAFSDFPRSETSHETTTIKGNLLSKDKYKHEKHEIFIILFYSSTSGDGKRFFP